MENYVERVTEIYAALRESEKVDQGDVATLAVAILQEEAKDARMEFIDERKDARVKQMRFGDSSTTEEQGAERSKEDWRKDPATDAQKKALRNLGVSFEDGLTKGEASNLIDQAKAQQEAEA